MYVTHSWPFMQNVEWASKDAPTLVLQFGWRTCSHRKLECSLLNLLALCCYMLCRHSTSNLRETYSNTGNTCSRIINFLSPCSFTSIIVKKTSVENYRKIVLALHDTDNYIRLRTLPCKFGKSGLSFCWKMHVSLQITRIKRGAQEGRS